MNAIQSTLTTDVGVRPAVGESVDAATPNSVPWYCFAAVFGALCIPLGTLWDISWHSTIGRDTFWNPAHIVMQLGGLIPGTICGWLLFIHTFQRTPERDGASVRLLGIRGPLGAFVTCWGCLMMLLSAPFDNWWHDAYGLDVQILSPPHVVLALGMYGVAVGALLLVCSWQNRIRESGTAGDLKTAGSLVILAVGVLVTMASVFVTELSSPNHQHGSRFYQASAWVYPWFLSGVARASSRKWAATKSALIYMGILCGMIWILPLFEAHPKLAPIYTPVDHMVPPVFPLLLVLPALGIDLVIRLAGGRFQWWKTLLLAVALGVVFMAIFIPVQWKFSEFLLSPAGRNGFFSGNGGRPYFSHPGEHHFRFWDEGPAVLGMAAIPAIAALTGLKCWAGLLMGGWLSKVRR